jgi:hypothetical protein
MAASSAFLSRFPFHLPFVPIDFAFYSSYTVLDNWSYITMQLIMIREPTSIHRRIRHWLVVPCDIATARQACPAPTALPSCQ